MLVFVLLLIDSAFDSVRHVWCTQCIDINITTLCTPNIFTIYFSFSFLHFTFPSINDASVGFSYFFSQPFKCFFSHSISHSLFIFVIVGVVGVVSPARFSVLCVYKCFDLVFCRAAIFDPLHVHCITSLCDSGSRYSLKIALERHKFNGLHSMWFFSVISTPTPPVFFCLHLYLIHPHTHLHISASDVHF